MANLLAEVDKFRSWAITNPSTGRYGEWECDYMEWAALHDAVLKFVANRPFDAWSRTECAQVLYAIARDNEIQYLSREIRKRHPELLQPLARAALDIGERDDRWQLAVELRYLGAESEVLLLEMTRDENEYVRRHALESLLRIGSPAAEEVAMAAWHRPDAEQQWSRMMALYCLHHMASPQLEGLLAQAEVDEREFLREYAIRIRRGEPPD